MSFSRQPQAGDLIRIRFSPDSTVIANVTGINNNIIQTYYSFTDDPNVRGELRWTGREWLFRRKDTDGRMKIVPVLITLIDHEQFNYVQDRQKDPRFLSTTSIDKTLETQRSQSYEQRRDASNLSRGPDTFIFATRSNNDFRDDPNLTMPVRNELQRQRNNMEIHNERMLADNLAQGRNKNTPTQGPLPSLFAPISEPQNPFLSQMPPEQRRYPENRPGMVTNPNEDKTKFRLPKAKL